MATSTEIIPAPAQQTAQPAVRKRIGNLEDEHIIEQVRRLRQESIDANRVIMNTALDCWDTYRNKQDFSSKATWESRVTLAKGHAAVKHAVANMMKLLTQAQQWVTVEDIARQEPSFAPLVEKGVLRLAEIAEFKEPLRDAFEFGFATMFGALKVLWKFEPYEHVSVENSTSGLMKRQSTRLAGSLSIQSLDPWKVHFGPKTKGGRVIDYVVEDAEADLCELKSAGGFENLDSFTDRDQKPEESDYRTADQRNEKRDSSDSRFRKRISLWEYWGDLIDEKTQQVVARNMHIIIGNGEKVIKFEQNPLWDGHPPYIFFSPLIVAGRFPGAGILEMNLEIKKAIDRIAQMWEDHLHFSVLPMWEAELGALENPEDVATGVFPGKVFRKKIGQGPVQVFRPLEVRPIQADSFNTVLAFDKEFQRGTFVTEQTQGLIDAKGETTATEVQQTAIASTLILSDIAAHIELSCLAPLGEMIWDRMFQFLDSTSSPNWSELLGNIPHAQILDQMPIGLRLEIIRGKYVFKSHGMSRAIERAAARRGLVEWVQVISQLGPAQAILNIPEIITRVHESYHFPNPQELLAPNWQGIFQQCQAAMLAQANPMVQQEARAAQLQQKSEADMREVALEKEMEGRNAIMTEAAKASFAPKEKKSEN